MASHKAGMTVTRVLAIQAALTLCIATAALALAGTKAGYSALIGGGINFLTTAYFARRVFTAGPGSTAKRMVRAFYVGEVIKIVLTVALFTVVFLWLDVAFLPLFLAYVVTMLAFWIALPFTL